MRKFLLASAATLGATVGLTGIAAAQMTGGTPGPMPMGVMSMPVQPPPYLGGNNSLNSDGSALPSSPVAPTPGSMVIHLNGRVWFYGSFQGGSGYSVSGPAGTSNKLSPFGFTGYARLYPGMDALATNGLRYGGIMEIRQNFVAPGTGGGSLVGANSSGASGQSSGSTMYFRREAVYIGSDSVGIFRLGQDDGPISQFDGGVTTFQNFDASNWNGDGPNLQVGNTQPTWPFWSGIGNEYTISKAVYLSPTFAGFDFGLSYAPNNSVNTGSAFCPVAGPGCQGLTTSTAAGDSFRATNMVEIMGRYRGTFSGLGIYAEGGYVGSGHVHSSLPAGDLADGFSVGDMGLALTYAGFTVGGHTIFGNFNGQVGLQPKGAPAAVAWIAGVQYTTGPWTMGTSWFNYQSQGATALVHVSQRYENGFDIGGTYAIAPGLTAYAGYSYGARHQGGVDFIAGAFGPLNNTVHTQNVLIGTRVQW